MATSKLSFVNPGATFATFATFSDNRVYGECGLNADGTFYADITAADNSWAASALKLPTMAAAKRFCISAVVAMIG